MDITVGPLVNLWGFGPDKQPVKTPDAQQDAAAKSAQRITASDGDQPGRQAVSAKDIPDLFVDLSTVGEGYAADHLARLMEQEGISRYLVSVGGALASRGMNAEGQPWRWRSKPTDRENAVRAIVDISGPRHQHLRQLSQLL